MNILKRFARQANKATATNAELFYDLEKETVAYLDTNGKSIGLLNKAEDAPSDKCVLLIRTDGIKVNKITAQNTLNPSDYQFELSVVPGIDEQINFVLKNQRNKVFSDMNITRITFDHFFEGTATEYHVRWKIADNQLIFVVFNSEGAPLSFREEIVSIWLEIEVFKNVESEVFRIIETKEKKKEEPPKPVESHIFTKGTYTLTKNDGSTKVDTILTQGVEKDGRVILTGKSGDGSYIFEPIEGKIGQFRLVFNGTIILGIDGFDLVKNTWQIVTEKNITFTITYKI